MKFLIAFLLIAVIVTQVLGSDEEEWQQYKEKFNKKYKSPEEDQRRSKLYFQSKKMVQEHNAKYDKGEVSYYLGINQFSDLHADELKQMHGARLPEQAKP